MHRAGNIDDKNVVARVDGLHGDLFGRLNHRQKEVLAAVAAFARRPLVEHHARFNLLTGEPVVEDEVAVVLALGASLQRHGGVVLVVYLDVYPVGGRAHFLQANGRAQRHLDVKRRCRGLACGQIRLADPGRARLAGRRAVVARPDHGRKDKLVVARLRHQQLGVAQLDRDVVAGQDVGDVHLEHIGQLLLQQRGGFAFFFGLVVVAPGLLLFADVGGDETVGEAHIHAIDGGAGRAGKHVIRLNGALALVLVALGDGDIGNHAGDAHIDLGRFERQLVQAGLAAFDEKVRTLGLEPGRVQVLGLRLRRAGRQGEKAGRGQRGGGGPEPARPGGSVRAGDGGSGRGQV